MERGASSSLEASVAASSSRAPLRFVDGFPDACEGLGQIPREGQRGQTLLDQVLIVGVIGTLMFIIVVVLTAMFAVVAGARALRRAGRGSPS